MKIERVILFILISLSSVKYYVLHAENFITNGGFEGTPGIEVIPESWQPGCGNFNTPDTQPGWWNIENEPVAGQSYINLLYKEDGTKESVFQKLLTPLAVGSCFMIEIYLAKACQDSVSNLYPFDLNNPGDLTIRGSNEFGCNNGQILGVFEQIDHCSWKKYYAVFQALEEINYIYLEFNKGISGKINGSVLIDEMKLDYTTPFPVEEYTINYNESLTLNTFVNSELEHWEFSTGTEYNDVSSVDFVFTENTQVTVTYWTLDSCFLSQSFTILVNPLIPNIITADNNGINDAFIIAGITEDARLTVFNRWGNIIYLNHHYSNTWIPQDMSSGVYFYILELKETGRFYAGTVTIV